MSNDNLSMKFPVFRVLGQQPLLLILQALLVTACVSAPLSPTMMTPTPTAAGIVPAATATVASPITLVATMTNRSSTAVPPAISPADDVAIEGTQTDGIETATNQKATMMETNQMKIQIGEGVLTATLADNTSVAALKEALAAGPITIEMRDYASMEKVGPLGFDLPRNDEPIAAEAGDLILYQGNAFVIYYAPNSWNFTRLGKVDGVSAAELKAILGAGDVAVTLSLPQE